VPRISAGTLMFRAVAAHPVGIFLFYAQATPRETVNRRKKGMPPPKRRHPSLLISC